MKGTFNLMPLLFSTAITSETCWFKSDNITMFPKPNRKCYSAPIRRLYGLDGRKQHSSK
jgi:hypothetical protein